MPRMERDPNSHALVFYPTPEEEAVNNLQQAHADLQEAHLNLIANHEDLKSQVADLKAAFESLNKNKGE